MNRKPIIIDCDPGVDDCIALLLALSSEVLDVKLITTVGGNVELSHTTQNALDLIQYAGKDVKVAAGMEKPLLRNLRTATHVHGENGRGTAIFEKSPKKADNNAIDAMYQQIKENSGEIEIIAIGPLTNVAALLIAYPDVKTMIKRILVMGGAAYGGNITPFAEFNIFVDPEAAKIVFDSKLPITMIGLDATMQAYVTKDDIELIVENRTKITEQLENLLKSSLAVNEHWNNKGAVLHDALAIAYMINEDILTTEKCYVGIEDKSELTLGQTVITKMDYKGYEKNIDVAFKVDREMFLGMLIDMVDKYN